jgi:hypothetical protein
VNLLAVASILKRTGAEIQEFEEKVFPTDPKVPKVDESAVKYTSSMGRFKDSSLWQITGVAALLLIICQVSDGSAAGNFHHIFLILTVAQLKVS